MKAIRLRGFALLLVILVSSFGCNHYDLMGNEEITISEFIRTNYTDDARMLYVEHVSQDSIHPEHNRLEIDDKGIQEVLKAIEAVHTLDTDRTRFIFHEFAVSKLPYEMRQFRIGFDRYYESVEPLRNGIPKTGFPEIDDLLNLSGVQVDHYREDFMERPVVLFSSDRDLNLEAMIRRLEMVPGVRYASRSQSFYNSPQPDIRMVRKNDVTYFRFAIPRSASFRATMHDYRVENATARYLGETEGIFRY